MQQPSKKKTRVKTMRSPGWMNSLTPERRARHMRQQLYRRVAGLMLVSVFVVSLVLSVS